MNEFKKFRTMKKKLFLFAIATACLALIVGGCKKDGDENHSEPADISLLTNQWASSIAIGESATDILFAVNVPNSHIVVGIMNDEIKAAFEEAGMTVTDKTYEYVAEYEITDIDAEAGVIYCSSIVKDENSAPKSAAPADPGSAEIPTGDVEVLFSNLTATSVTLTYSMMPFQCTATSGAEIVSVPAEPDVPSPALSIEKQWVAPVLIEGEEGKILLDISETTIEYAQMSPSVASMIQMYVEAGMLELPNGFNTDTDFLLTSSITISEMGPSTGDSGSIKGSDAMGMTYTLEYSNLSATSVSIKMTIVDPYGESTVSEFELTAAETTMNIISLY